MSYRGWMNLLERPFLDKRSCHALPNAPCGKPLSLDSAVNRTHIESAPFIGFAEQIPIPVLSPGAERIIDHINSPFMWICAERDLIPAKELGRFSDRTLRPINDE